MFKWSCLSVAVLSVLALGWTINDVRLELKQTVHVLNEHLPPILENTKASTATLAALSQDIKELRDLAGATGPRDKSLVRYADSVMDFIERSGGKIGLSKKVFGSGLKDIVPADEWVVSARKEALWLTFRSKSRLELLDRLCTNKFGSSWYIQLEGAKPQELIVWLKANHSDTKALKGKAQ